MPCRRLALTCLALGLSGAGVLLDAQPTLPDTAIWPHWRGPLRNGVSAAKGLARTWSTTENIAWKLPLPDKSGSTPIIWGDLVFLNVATAPGGELELWAVDRRKQAPVWKATMGTGNFNIRKQNMSTPSPVTDGRTVWAMTGTGILKAFDFSGKELWARDIQQDYGRFGLNWGYGSSPLLYEDSLYVQVLHGMKTDDPSYLLRIDARTGKTIWRVERPTTAIRESPDAYTTPAVILHAGQPELVITGGDAVTGHDLATGRELWRFNGMNPTNNPAYRTVTSPVVANGLIFTCARERPLVAIKPGGRGDIAATHKLWSFDFGPDVPTPVSDGTLLYVVRDNGVVHALDVKTGQVVWGPQRLRPGTYSASPVLAEGRIYITNEDGLTSVFRAGPSFELLAENALDDYTLSSPAISDGQIFIRTTGHLWAIGERRPK